MSCANYSMVALFFYYRFGDSLPPKLAQTCLRAFFKQTGYQKQYKKIPCSLAHYRFLSHAACDISSFCVVGGPFGYKKCFELKDLGGVQPASWLGVEQTLVGLNLSCIGGRGLEKRS